MDRIIYFDLAALAIVLILVFSMFSRKMTTGRINSIFLLLLGVLFLNTLFSLATNFSLSFIESPETRKSVRTFFNTMYYIFRLSEGPIYFIFVSMLAGSWTRFTEKKSVVILFLLPLIISIVILIINNFNGMVFYFDTDGNYYRGPLVAVTYSVGAFYLLLSFILLIKNRVILGTEKLLALLSMYPLLIAAMVVQFIWKQYLLEMFAMSIMAMLCTSTVLKPEENVDFTTGARSYNGFTLDMRRYFMAKIPASVILIRIKNNSALISLLGNEHHRHLLQDISRILVSPEITDHPKKVNRELYYLYAGLYAITVDGKYHEPYAEVEAEKIFNRLKGTLHTQQMDLDLDIAVSTIRFPADVDNWDDLLLFANTFDRVASDTEVTSYLKIAPNKQFRMAADIDSIIGNALNNNNFVLYYQPIFSVKEKRFVTAEALIRLIDEKNGIVSPGLFIPAAEKNGTIHRIGDFVICDVCRFISENDLQKLGVRFIEVNLSTVQCMRSNVVERINQVLEDYHIPPGNINLEITETASNFVYDTVKANILSLHSLGLDFALDDYGTGFSNLQQVVDMPFKVIKLDKRFVDEWEHPRMRTVIQNTIHMIKDLGNEIVVEGVETKEAAEWFAGQGCDYIQGFYYAKPMPEKDFLAFLAEHNL